MQQVFVLFQSILLVIFLIQDTVNLAPFNNLAKQVKFLGWTKLILGTALMSGLLGLSLYLTIHYSGVPLPTSAKVFFIIWYGMTMMGMFASWYKPYFFGLTPKEMEMYNQLFAGTHTILPVRNGFPGPNTLHLVLHFFGFPCAVLGFLKVAGVF